MKIVEGIFQRRIKEYSVKSHSVDLGSDAMLITTHIEAPSGIVYPRLREMWFHRELIYFFVWRDIKVRYKQTVLGVAWAIIQPFLTMVIFSIFFGKLAKMPSDGLPYPLFNYAAMVPWTFFATGLLTSANSLVVNANMVKKIYFPRLTLPFSGVLSCFIDFALSFLVLLAMMIYFGKPLTLNIVFLPLLVLLTLITSLGVGMWFAALNAKYRDVRYIVPFLVQAWLFMTPIAYPSSLLPEPWHTVYGINPMAGVVEGFRWALLGTDTAPGPIILVSAFAAVLIFIGGLFYFQKMENDLADII